MVSQVCIARCALVCLEEPPHDFIVSIREIISKQNVMSIEHLVLSGQCRCFKMISHCANHFDELGH